MKYLLLVHFFSLFLISCVESNKSDGPCKVGDTIEISDYNLVAVNKRKISNNKLLLIDFWATWCGPCIASFPHLEEMQKKYNDNLQILAVSDEKVGLVESFLSKKNFELSFFIDVEKKLFKNFNIKIRPTSCLISENGTFLWSGDSEDLESVLTEYLESGEILNPKISESNRIFYEHDSNNDISNDESYFSISDAQDPRLYFAKNQKNEEDFIDIKYVSVPLSDIIKDFFQIEDFYIINENPDLDTILLNIEAQSEVTNYKEGKDEILQILQSKYGFNINTKTERIDVNLLTIKDENLLKINLETIEGGGMARRENGEHIITRLSLSQLASYFQKRLKVDVQYIGSDKSKYNFNFKDFESLYDLNLQLNEVGIDNSSIQRIDVEYLLIN